MPRFTAVFPFDAQGIEDARLYARDLRRTVRRRLGAEWDDNDARLMRVQDGDADGRHVAVIKFNADGLGAARDFARTLRRTARRRLDGFSRRNTKLLKLVDPTEQAPVATEAAPAVEADES
jgi:hypothetical protein